MKKKQLIDILNKYAETFHSAGSCGELGDSTQAIDIDSFGDIADDILGLEAKSDDFEKAVEPAIRYLFKNHNPHTKIFINYSNAELLQGEQCCNLNDEVPD